MEEPSQVASEASDAGAAPDPGSVPVADRGWYLAVEFQQSTSAHFERAVKAAAKHPGFSLLIDESGACVYRVIARADQLGSLGRLLSDIRGWKNTRYYVCGVETTIEGIEGWLACFQQRRKEQAPHCCQPLGSGNPARRLGCMWAGISLEASDWDAWYRRGGFDRDGVFRVDKEQLLFRIKSWERIYGACPFADSDRLRRIVALLPETIDPRHDRRWRVARAYYNDSLLLLTPTSQAAYVAFLRECLAPLLDASGAPSCPEPLP